MFVNFERRYHNPLPLLTMVLLHKDLTEAILKVYFEVYNTLGYGFLEKVYQNAMYMELSSRNFNVEAQRQIKVQYKGTVVGEYYADLIVNNLVIIELKAAECLVQEHEWQILNYLKATDIEVGLLLNFGKSPQFVRKIFENTRKDLR